MSNLLETLPEIQEKIFSYCHATDLRSLACCNSVYNNALKQILWQTVNIELGSLENANCKNKNKFKNLQFTTSLRFHGNHSALSGFNKYSSSEKNEKRLKKISANYRKIIGYCNYKVLDTLIMEGAVTNKEDIKYSCKELKQLKNLTISHIMHIEATEFNEISKLKELVDLNVMFSEIGDLFLSTISGKLSKLRSLNIRRCLGVTNDGLCSLNKLVSLEALDVSGLEISDDGIAHISTLVSLKELNISHCVGITDKAILHLNKLISLREINLSWCKQITDKNFHILRELKSLRKLDISRCSNVGNTGLSSICIIESLVETNFGACVDVGDPGILIVSKKLTNLIKLHLVYTGVSDQGLKYLTNLHFLIALDITGCANVTDQGISYLSTLTSLKELNISCTQVTDDGLSHLHLLTNLKVLNVSNCNHLTDTALSHIRNMISLQDLDVSFLSITDDGLKHLNALPYLKRLRCFQTAASDEGLSELNSNISVEKLYTM